MTLAKLALANLAAAVVGFVAAAETIPPPTSMWPTSVVGWITTVGVLASIVTFVRTTHKQGVERAERQVQEAARVTAIDRRLDNFGQRMDDQMNGFGKRLERVESDGESDRVAVTGLLQSMAEARAHREHMGASQVRIESALNDLRDEVAESRRQMMAALRRTP